MVSPLPAQSVTIEGMELYGGPGQIWNTFNDSLWVLGVSTAANGPLVNNPDTTISNLPFDGFYWLYAEPTNLGNPTLVLHLSDNTTIQAQFQVSGPAGTENVWTKLSGSDQISLGWAAGTADKVYRLNMVPGGNNDFYLMATIGNPVPVPGTVWLLGFGLLGLFGWRRIS
jgi:hypothetical protein